jgi:amino acid transporter
MSTTLIILSIVFIETIFSVLGVTDKVGKVEYKLLSVVVLTLINAVNLISIKASTQLNNFFIVTKFVAIFRVVLASIIVVILSAKELERDVDSRD